MRKILQFTCLIFAALGALTPSDALAQPRAESHLVQSTEAVSAGEYWTSARRAAAIARDEILTALPTSLEPAATAGPRRVDVPGALPIGSLISPGQAGPPAEPGSTAGLASEDGDHWSPARLKNGITRGMDIDSGHSFGQSSDPSESASADPQLTTYVYPFDRYQVLTYLYYNPFRLAPYIAIGKLFFNLSGTDYVCSASVIRPHLLITARHCIYSYSSAAWATNIAFYPGYISGANSYLGGVWIARALRTWTSNAAGQQYDIGFIQTFNLNRTSCAPGIGNPQIENYTGYLGYSYDGSYAQRQWETFGYPQGAPFNGTRMIECSTSTGQLNVGGETNTVEVGCDMTGGSSGGPWLMSFAPNVTGAFNLANGLNSFKYISPSHPLAMNGPQFLTGNFLNLLNAAVADPCP